MRWGVDRNETDNGEIVNVYFVYTESKKHEIYYNVTNNRIIRMISFENLMVHFVFMFLCCILSFLKFVDFCCNQFIISNTIAYLISG